MDVVSCAFESCRGIAADVYGLPTATAYMSSQVVEGPVLTDQNFIDAGNDNSELPEAVVHPEHPGDVANSIKHAAKIGMGLSVKTSGHSFIGASTKKGTLNLNLSKLKKYALPETLSDGVFECPVADSDPESAIAAACKLAIARGKSAVMRGGGGQICDEAFRTLETWNSDPNNRPYHAMIGAAGTVGLAGWTFGGGLGGTTSMRSYGVGVDQVLHIEMVLPDGRFVRFGPSAWKPPKDGNQLYPQTTDVTGFCNEGDLSDESSWSWVSCDDEYDFADLWFAVRGGGGGSWGVVTSMYYQLHDKPGLFQPIEWFNTLRGYMIDPNRTVEENIELAYTFNEFFFLFLFNPSRLSIPTSVSNSCSSANSPTLSCYDGAGQAFIDAWATYGGGEMPLTFTEFPSYASMKIFQVGEFFGGRVSDDPIAQFLLNAPNPISVPLDVVTNKLDEFLAIYVPCFLSTIGAQLTQTHQFDLISPDLCLATGLPYNYGGNVPFASDGADAYPSHRRNDAFIISPRNPATRKELLKLVWDLPPDQEFFTGETFPGLYCNNHLWATTVPRKSNWLLECNNEFPWQMPTTEDPDCMSYAEAAFGTKNLRRLEEIHSKIDPNRLFNTVDGPGYSGSFVIDSSGASTARYLLVVSSCFVLVISFALVA